MLIFFFLRLEEVLMDRRCGRECLNITIFKNLYLGVMEIAQRGGIYALHVWIAQLCELSWLQLDSWLPTSSIPLLNAVALIAFCTNEPELDLSTEPQAPTAKPNCRDIFWAPGLNWGCLHSSPISYVLWNCHLFKYNVFKLFFIELNAMAFLCSWV